MKYQLVASKSGDFSKSKTHVMTWSDEAVGFVNPYDPTQIIQVLHNGSPDPLAWALDDSDRAGREMELRFIGGPVEGFKGFVRITELDT